MGIYGTLNTTTTNTNAIWTAPIYYSTSTIDYKVQFPYGSRSSDPLWELPAQEAAPKPESDLAWLKRRVAEVSWTPA